MIPRSRIREVIGTDVLISTSMDLHGNVSWRLAEHTDLITCYRFSDMGDNPMAGGAGSE